MSDEEHQFIATGPIETDSEPNFSAFSTGWTQPEFDYGANFQGAKCGVYASALHGGDREVPSNVPQGLGVCAIGRATGVYGEARDGGVGVRGESVGARRGEGVRGVGEDKGVVGVTLPSRGHGFRVGVLGSVNANLNPNLPAGINRDAGDAGVVGVGSPRGIAVMGLSGAGPAVEGRSEVGPGGRFRSGRGAQVHLDLELKGLPSEGHAGDLLAIADDPTSPDPEASLWFCTRGSAPNRPADWKQLA